jgi:hypothetical protein
MSSFIGDVTQVENSCGPGCFHGFVPSASKTDNFKVNIATGTFCLTVQKLDDNSMPVIGWPFQVTDTVGAVNTYLTDTSGSVKVCALVAGAYTVAEDINSVIISLTVNGKVQPIALTIYSFTWVVGQTPPVIVFKNSILAPA